MVFLTTIIIIYCCFTDVIIVTLHFDIVQTEWFGCAG